MSFVTWKAFVAGVAEEHGRCIYGRVHQLISLFMDNLDNFEGYCVPGRFFRPCLGFSTALQNVASVALAKRV